MSKLIKRIASVATAALMATTMAVAASAESDVIKGTVSGKETLGIVAAGESYVEGYKMMRNQTAATLYKGDGEVFVSLDIDDYYTGDLKWRSERRGVETYTAGVIGLWVGTNTDYGKVSLFSAHETYSDDGESWGRYLGLVGVNI